MDTIASCAFGVDSQSFDNQESTFVTYAKAIFTQDVGQILKFLVCMFVPYGKNVLNMLGKSTFFKDKETEFFYNVLLESLKQRRQSKVRRNDLVDLMLDAIKGDLDQDDHHEDDNQFDIDAKLKHESSKKHEFDELVVVATAIGNVQLLFILYARWLFTFVRSLAQNPIIHVLKVSFFTKFTI